jgi:hypothetical protein
MPPASFLKDQDMLAIRNKAAHDEVLRRDEARQTRAWAMQILGQASPIMSACVRKIA